MTDARTLVEQFSSAIREAFQVELSAESVAQLYWALSRIGQQSGSDLIAAALLACYEERGVLARPLADDDIRRVVWRVVKTISREAARSARLEPYGIHKSPSGLQPEKVAVLNEEIRRVLEAVDKLPPIDQAAFAKWINGDSVIQISRDLEITESNVRQRLYRARKQVRQILGE